MDREILKDAGALKRSRHALPSAARYRAPRDVLVPVADDSVVGRRRPQTASSSVDFPAPFGPITPWSTPSPRTSRSTSVNARTEP